MEEVEIQLKSHKVTDRRKGRKALEELLDSQRKPRPERCLRLLNAAAQYVERELDGGQARGRTSAREAAVLFRKCISAFGKAVAAHPTGLRDVFNHVLFMLQREEADADFTKQYADTMCEILQSPQWSSKMDASFPSDLFRVVQESLTNNLTSEPHLRLLRVASTAIRVDLHRVLPSFMDWVGAACRQISSHGDRSQYHTTVQALAVTVDALNREYGSHMGQSVVDSCGDFVNLALQQMVATPVQHRDIFTQCFQSVLDVLDAYGGKLVGAPTACGAVLVAGFHPMLEAMFQVFCDDELVRAVILFDSQGSQRTKVEAFVNVSHCPRTRTFLDVASRCLLQMHLLSELEREKEEGADQRPASSQQSTIFDGLLDVVADCCGQNDTTGEVPMLLTAVTQDNLAPSTPRRQLKLEALLLLMASALEKWPEFLAGAPNVNATFAAVFDNTELLHRALRTLSSCMENVRGSGEQGALLVCLREAVKCFRRCCRATESNRTAEVPPAIARIVERLLSPDFPFITEFNRPQLNGLLDPLCDLCLELCDFSRTLQTAVYRQLHGARLWAGPHHAFSPSVLELLGQISSYAHVEGAPTMVATAVQELLTLSQSPLANVLHEASNDSGLRALLLGASWLKTVASAPSSVRARFGAMFERGVTSLTKLIVASLSPHLTSLLASSSHDQTPADTSAAHYCPIFLRRAAPHGAGGHEPVASDISHLELDATACLLEWAATQIHEVSHGFNDLIELPGGLLSSSTLILSCIRCAIFLQAAENVYGFGQGSAACLMRIAVQELEWLVEQLAAADHASRETATMWFLSALEQHCCPPIAGVLASPQALDDPAVQMPTAARTQSTAGGFASNPPSELPHAARVADLLVDVMEASITSATAQRPASPATAVAAARRSPKRPREAAWSDDEDDNGVAHNRDELLQTSPQEDDFDILPASPPSAAPRRLPEMTVKIVATSAKAALVFGHSERVLQAVGAAVFGPEAAIPLLDQLATLPPAMASQYGMECLDHVIVKPWDGEWNFVGLHRLLIGAQAAFLGPATNAQARAHEALQELVLSNDSSLHRLLDKSWRTRIQGLEAAGCLFSQQMDQFCEPFQALLLKRLEDIDSRVRQVAIRWLPILTRHLQDDARARFFQALSASQQSSERKAGSVFARVSRVNALASFGMANAAAMQHAVTRLLLESDLGTSAAGTDGKHALPTVWADQLIINVLGQLAKEFNFASATTLLEEMKMSLAFDWWRDQRSLESFPAHWFGFASASELLVHSAHLLVPACCFLPSQLRWDALREMCRLQHMPDDDHHVASLLQAHLPVIRALRYLMGDADGGHEIRQFLQRVFRVPIGAEPSATLHWIIMLPTYLLQAPFRSFGSDHVAQALERLGTLIENPGAGLPAASLALGAGNLIELLTALHSRLLELQRSPRARGIAECLVQLSHMVASTALHHSRESTWPVLFIMRTVVACLETCVLRVPQAAGFALETLAALAHLQTESQSGRHALEHTIVDITVLAMLLSCHVAAPQSQHVQERAILSEAAGAVEQHMRTHDDERQEIGAQVAALWQAIHLAVASSAAVASAVTSVLPFSPAAREAIQTCGVEATWMTELPSLDAKLSSLISTTQAVIRGTVVSDVRLFWELLSLRVSLDSGSANLWESSESNATKLVSLLSNVGRTVRAPFIQATIVEILGLMGRPPMDVESHNLMRVELFMDTDEFVGRILPVLHAQTLAVHDASYIRVATQALRKACAALSASCAEEQAVGDGKVLLDYFCASPAMQDQGLERSCLVPRSRPALSAWHENFWRIEDKGYSEWICKLVSALIADVSGGSSPSARRQGVAPPKTVAAQLLVAVHDMCLHSWRLAETVFPLLCAELLASDDKGRTRKLLSDRFAVCVLADECKSVEAKALVVETFNFLVRLEIGNFVEMTTTRRSKELRFSISAPSSPIRPQFEKVLDVDLWLLAEVATRVGRHCSALQIIELALAAMPTEGAARTPSGPLSTRALAINSTSTATTITDGQLRDGLSPADVLLELSTRLHDPDVVLGLPLSNLPALEAMVFERHGDVLHALTSYDSLLQQSGGSNTMHPLADAGMRRLLKSTGTGELLRIYEVANPSSAIDDTARLMDRLLQKTQHAVQFNDDAVAHSTRDLIAFAKRKVSGSVFQLGCHESLQCLADQMLNLQLLRECEEILDVPVFDQAFFVQTQLLPRWKARGDGAIPDGVTVEQILSQRFHLLHSLPLTRDGRLQCLLPFAHDLAGRIGTMSSPYALTQLIDQVHSDILEAAGQGPVHSNVWWWLVDEAKAAWAQQRTAAAFLSLQSIATALNYNTPADHVLSDRGFSKTSQFLRRLAAQRQHAHHAHQHPLHTSQQNELLSEVLSLLGDWSASLRQISSERILREYLQPAEQLLGAADSHTSVRERLADYFVELYNSTKTRMESAEWFHTCRVAAERKAQLDELRRTVAHTPNGMRHIRMLERECKIDEDARNAVERSTQQYLRGALEHHLTLLQHSRHLHAESVFTVARLWLQNSGEAWLNDIVGEHVGRIASFKFLPIAYQLCSRLSTEGDPSFQAHLQQLVLRIAQDHPHHVLLYLLSIKNGQLLPTDNSTDRDFSEYSKNVPVPKIDAASNLLQQLETDTRHEGLLQTTSCLVQAYIDLAHFDVRPFRERRIAFSHLPSSTTSPPLHQCLQQRAFRRGRVEMPAVITQPPPIREDRDYADIVRVRDFGDAFEVSPSGISRPKIVRCTGTDGRVYKQLVKATTDDLRQDAIMQQVFNAVNGMLRKNPECKTTTLSIRTYAVVPLSPTSGVLEWVDNTQVFGEYLIGHNVGAHARYHPQDWSHVQCRQFMKEAGNRKRQVFDEVCEHFTPSFRYFFLERFPQPQLWFARRTSYVRSVAVSSIVGYILGIGDRHAYNILLDRTTAEVVHIDFGITFEQGKVLTTPETVPFRLTRDIVDGMGITGTEGTFRRCCERVLTVLKKNATTISTILEVIIHDPMFRWLLSPVEIRRRQQQEGEELFVGTSVSDPVADPRENGSRKESRASADAAERALLRIKQKLQGYEDPSGVPLGVQGHVNLLINMAQDPDNLCRIFPGWAPWL